MLFWRKKKTSEAIVPASPESAPAPANAAAPALAGVPQAPADSRALTPQPAPPLPASPAIAAQPPALPEPPPATAPIQAEKETPAAAPAADAPKSLWARLKAGLGKSSDKLTFGITKIFTHKRLDAEALDALEELLITADLGPQAAAELTAALKREKFGRDVTDEEVRSFLGERIAEKLKPYASPLVIDNAAHKPFVIMMVGVNGTGKTTTLGKIARRFADEGQKVMLAAGDTFRAAAVEQLKIWGERAGVPVIALQQGGDAAALAFDALDEALRQGTELLLLDTAGRLHNKADLMAELQKVVRSVKKKMPSAPHLTLLVVDATTGQNAIAQAETFKKMVDVNGLIVTKLDGSAKGGVIVALADRIKLPIYAIGVGESIEDLQPFDPADFARALLEQKSKDAGISSKRLSASSDL